MNLITTIQHTELYWRFWQLVANVTGAVQRFAVVRMGYHNNTRSWRITK